VNRSTAVVGALLGGLVAAALGYRGTLIGVAAVFLVASLVAALSLCAEAAADARLRRLSAAASGAP